LKAITHNLPAVVTEPAVALIGQECYTTLVYNLDLTSSECLKLALSKVLGLGMVAGGAILKLPQILTVVRSGSARGLSLSSYILDTVATGITASVAYNVRNGFPFSTYGEMGFLLAQNAVLIVLITSYSARPTLPRLVPLVALLGSLAYALASPSLVPASTLSFLQTLTIPISLSSKVPQIVENYKAKSTGQLSAFLVINSLAGCLARVFTTMSETKDPLLLWNFALAALLNGVIFAQMIVY
ncbi:mannose-P-dolichol utilization defect 1 protein, partial [Rhodotorula sp. JG-1b]